MTDAVIVGLLSAIPATIAALAAWHNGKKVASLKIEIDGRMEQLLQSVKTENQAIGHAAGVEQERDRDKR
jgi:hypothetical protein